MAAPSSEILPGYTKGLVSKAKSTRAPIPVIENLSGKEWEKRLDGIHQDAKAMWQEANNDLLTPPDYERPRRPTTYAHFYYDKVLDEPTQIRPLSPTRCNKPHPPEVFLTAHLKNVPGFFEYPKLSFPKKPYKVDGSPGLPLAEHMRRREIKQKTTGLTDEKITNTFKKNQSVDHCVDPVSAQGVDSWLKLADNKDKMIVKDMFDMAGKKEYSKQVATRYAKPAVKLALGKWIDNANHEEIDAAYRLFHCLDIAPQSRTLPPVNVPPPAPRPVVRRFKREYVIHPELG